MDSGRLFSNTFTVGNDSDLCSGTERASSAFVKTFKENEEPKNNTLISFRAERFGESVILTHMFVKSEVRNQETFYITQAPDSSYYDTYETRHEDLVGSYLFHIVYGQGV